MSVRPRLCYPDIAYAGASAHFPYALRRLDVESLIAGYSRQDPSSTVLDSGVMLL